ncbi:MAG: NAD-dependent protein deacylase [Isosphaeraceae bacterium]|jgi:NAD-dependent deacetylase
MGIVEQADCRREQADCRRSTLSLSRADERAVDVVIELLRPARRLLFITGAGISADSGLPTYRGRDGLYSRDGLYGRDSVYRDGLTTHGLTIEQALSGPMLASRPEITWHYLFELERAARGGVPNRGHRVIAEMESYFDAVWTVTQNVDGLHSRAGSRQVLDVHGDLHDLLCTQCDYKVTVPDYADLAVPPLCPRCQGILRPTVVLFGEQVPEEKLDRLWYEFGVGFDVVFSVGTSSLFEYIAAPVELARAAGIATVEINPETTAVTSAVEVKISGGAASVLDLLWERYLVGWPWW